MDEFYLFWNAFNLIAIGTLILTAGISIGGLISSIVAVVTQIEDQAIKFSLRFICLVLTCYFASPLLLNSVKDFSIAMWTPDTESK